MLYIYTPSYQNQKGTNSIRISLISTTTSILHFCATLETVANELTEYPSNGNTVPVCSIIITNVL